MTIEDIISFVFYEHHPEKVHISIDTRCISIEELKNNFKISKVSYDKYDKHFVTCDIEPKRKGGRNNGKKTYF